jgi:hypothetical protein
MGTQTRLLAIGGVIASASAIWVMAIAFADDADTRTDMPIVIAQAGSTGGTIGKQEKSVSGSDASERRIDKPAQRGKSKPSQRTVNVGPTSATPQYLGCFREQGILFVASTRGRDMGGSMAIDPAMTSMRCVAICRSQGFAFAGTQYSTQCFCANQYGRSGPADNCKMACGGNPAEMCGGAWANSVYRVSGRK